MNFIKRIVNVVLVLIISFIIDGCKKDDNGTMTDQEGNVYKTITISSQTWMAENLRTTTYRNGQPIIKVIYSDSNWQQNGGYWDSENVEIYGRLYTWQAVSNSNISPVGWHVPSDAEWTTLTTFLGGEDVAGKKMKETGTAHWADPAIVPAIDYQAVTATNESGFSAVPAGAYRAEGFPTVKGYYSFFWSSTESSSLYAWRRCIVFYQNECFRYEDEKIFGFSVRLVKD